MSRSMFSSSWYRVADLRPRLRAHVDIHRHQFRGRLWYVLQDHAGGRYHRFSPEANLLIGQMDGTHTVQEIWERAGRVLGDDLPTQDEVIRLLAQLHAADLIHAEIPPDIAELAERSTAMQRRALLQQVKNPLALRLPLFDPDRFLVATLPLVRPLLTPAGFVAWLALILVALVQAVTHWAALTENVADRVFVAENLAVLALTYIPVKALHEFGHGYATRAWGGEVHDMGLMFLVFIPVPYVDASSSSAFRSKWRRAAVAGAGIMVEMSLAAAALLVWLAVEPGLVRAIAFNVMLIAGVSTLLFNGNPLLRYDGYYVLADLIEVPNLATRANKYVFYLIQKYVFGVSDLTSPATLASERPWLLFYSLAAFCYRLLIMSAIALFLATQYFVVGVLLAIWAAIAMLAVPAAKGVWFLLASPLLRRRRRRALAVSGALLAAAAASLLLIPLPYGTVVKGIVWVPDNAVVNAGADGFIDEVMARPDQLVKSGSALFRLRDPFLEAKLRVAEAELRERELRLVAVEFTDLVRAAVLREEIARTQANRDRLAERAAELVVRARADGRFVLPKATDQPGRYVKRGLLLGYVVAEGAPIVRVVVSQADIDLVRSRLAGVAVRFAGRISEATPARILRAEPAATAALSSPALSTEGGGDVLMDPRRPQHTLEKVFRIDLSLPAGTAAPPIGGRAYVRFDHGSAPLAFQIYRRLRQLFLSKLDV